jgi:hypothetical protein
MASELDNRSLFDRLSKPGEQYDEDWPEIMRQRVRNEGLLVGRNEWDSGGPGAGAGVNDVYLFHRLFFAEDDVGMFGPYETFLEAADAVGLLSAGEATTSIWISSD